MNDAIIMLIICFLIFLACREVMCWYWKINEIVKLLSDIKSALSEREE